MTTTVHADSDTLYEAALSAALRGWRVFPLRPGDKRPAVRDWETRATNAHARIDRAWSAGCYNVGIATGPSRLVVIDLDTPKDGDRPPPEWALPGVTCGADVLAVLAEHHGQPLPLDTYTVTTRRGGLHLYFQAPADTQLRNSSGALGWLVDTRAGGGYAVAAGSYVDAADGAGVYTTVNDADPVPLPGWLTDLLSKPPEPEHPVATPGELLTRLGRPSGYVGTALHREIQRVLDAGPGSRNHTLNAAAYALGQLAGADLLPLDLAQEALRRAGAASGLPGSECAATIRSGLSAGMNRPRAKGGQG